MGDEGMPPRDRGMTQSHSGESPLAAIYFDFDEFQLRGDAQSTLKSNAQLMRDNPSWQVQIEGNCDERGSDEYNLALGKKRAEAAKSYLVDLGIDATRIATISYGEENPAVQGHDEMAWSKNRRDDFVLR
jgi:peptidoglycan-associated lipoprotein